ncbi:hypothetical protein LOK49_LG11G00406, partial [Camellia lanceoleosa]
SHEEPKESLSLNGKDLIFEFLHRPSLHKPYVKGCRGPTLCAELFSDQIYPIHPSRHVEDIQVSFPCFLKKKKNKNKNKKKQRVMKAKCHSIKKLTKAPHLTHDPSKKKIHKKDPCNKSKKAHEKKEKKKKESPWTKEQSTTKKKKKK